MLAFNNSCSDSCWMPCGYEFAFLPYKAYIQLREKDLISTCVRINWRWYFWGEKSYYCHRKHLSNGFELRIWSSPQLWEHCIAQKNAFLCDCKETVIHIWVHNCAWNMLFKWGFQVPLLTLQRSTFQCCSDPAVAVTNQFPQSLKGNSQYWATGRQSCWDAFNSEVMAFVHWKLDQCTKPFSLKIRGFQLLPS